MRKPLSDHFHHILPSDQLSVVTYQLSIINYQLSPISHTYPHSNPASKLLRGAA